jgi:hypothetical protein
MALPRHKSIRQQIRELVKPRSESDELIVPDPVPVRKHVNILVEFPGFVAWFRRAHRGRQVVGVGDIVEYRRAKKDYETGVMFAMHEITAHEVGRALIAEIDRQPAQMVVIEPWNKAEANASARADDEEDATAVGMPLLDTDGKPLDGGGSGSGHGSDVTIRYTASMWGPDGTAHETGPGSDQDELLFHELVHAARDVNGVHYRLVVNQHYGNEEEFLGVLITNIYLSNKGQKHLRASHSSFSELKDSEHFLDNPHLSPSPRTLLERFRLNQPQFFKALARIGHARAAFNPVRQYAKERAQGILLDTGRRSPFGPGRSTVR